MRTYSSGPYKKGNVIVEFVDPSTSSGGKFSVLFLSEINRKIVIYTFFHVNYGIHSLYFFYIKNSSSTLSTPVSYIYNTVHLITLLYPYGED